MDSIIDDSKTAMEKKIENLDKELVRVRTGRASINLVDGVRINYYGNPTPLNQVASISTPDARSIVISPFEKKLISDIERAIQVADLGIQPVNDGNIVRLAIPPLNEERRKEIAKSIKKLGEDAKVGIRKVRQDSNSKVKRLEKSKELPEDLSKKLQKDIQNQTDSFIKIIDTRIAQKEQEILTI